MEEIFLKRLFGEFRIVVGPTNGSETIASARDVFKEIDVNFTAWGLDFPGRPTPETEIAIYQLAQDCKLREAYMNLVEIEKIFRGSSKLDDLCLQQGQIKRFCHDKWELCRGEGYSTLFLFTRGGEEVNEDKSNVFVARVAMDNYAQLKIRARKFWNEETWLAVNRPRIVTPAVTSFF